MLKTIPSVVRSRVDRVAVRHRYTGLQDTLNETIDDLYAAQDHDDRAALLDYAAQLIERLAELHTAAWGREADADGRPVAVSLAGQAALLRQVAATERAVIGTITWPVGQTPPDAEHAAELHAWTELAHTSAPERRAACLRRLSVLAAEHLGERSAEVLAVLAEVEDHRAAGNTVPPARPRFMLPRVLVGAFLALLALIGLAPGLDALGRVLLLAVVMASTYGALCVYVGVRGRSQRVAR
ncbi:hypothetical protein [Actinomadura sp. K4S16]|uniref:hypothetical protein n=1 Tax=Actinomadura sp. K4S16 TaxID=1316147 RepID=UPI0011ED9E9E|nr:hypothetical protein [Actinomadura sp. K4S16]